MREHRRIARNHRVERRLAQHPHLPVSRSRSGDQTRRSARRPRIAGRAVRLSGAVRRHLRARDAHAGHRQYSDPDPAEGVEIRLRIAVQDGRLFRHHAPVYRQPVGHGQPGHAARQRTGHRACPRVRHVRFSRARSQALPPGSCRHRRSLPAAGFLEHHAVAHRERLLRRAGQQPRPGGGSGDAIHRAGPGAAAAHQSGAAGKIRARDDERRRGKRVRTARGRSRRSTKARA